MLPFRHIPLYILLDLWRGRRSACGMLQVYWVRDYETREADGVIAVWDGAGNASPISGEKRRRP